MFNIFKKVEKRFIPYEECYTKKERETKADILCSHMEYPTNLKIRSQALRLEVKNLIKAAIVKFGPNVKDNCMEFVRIITKLAIDNEIKYDKLKQALEENEVLKKEIEELKLLCKDKFEN